MTTTRSASASGFSLLPPEVRPVHYQLSLAPDLDAARFQGEEQVDLEVRAPVREIVLNALEIEVHAAQLTAEDGRERPAGRITYDEKAETVSFHFDTPVPAGPARLRVAFSGTLNDRLHGFYRAVYRDAEGGTRFLATTQFEPTDARRAFPCADEPALKATFSVSLVVPTGYAAVSNMPEEARVPAGPGLERVRFQKTPRMSTYLLAFIVGELESVQARAAGGTLIRVWTTPGQAERGRFALETAVEVLGYYNGYFGTPYPLPKLDHLALPDFAAGAMENWGAITYREVALLFDPQSSSPATRQRIAEVVAHEMAHMWFGDLVTMRWWNDLWLNESFASWMATKAVDTLHSDWRMWTQFIGADVIPGLNLDGLANSHPIATEVHNPAEVNQLFDAISYSKGASILRMLEQHLGAETFQHGLMLYVARHAYGNAEGADLWTALGEASGQDVPAIMGSWVQQVGFPVVTAQVRRPRGSIEVALSQQRFLYSGTNQDPTLWQIPIRVAARGDGHVTSILLRERAGEAAALPAGGTDAWLKVNADTTGFFRVRYAPEELARLIAAVRDGELSPADRLGLMDDTYALARAGLIEATQFLDLAEAYEAEEDYSVWSVLAAHLGAMELLTSEEPYASEFRHFGRRLLARVAGTVGWEPVPGEGHLRALLRSVVLSQSGAFGDEGVLAEARARFQRFLLDPASLPPELRGAVYGLAAEGGDEETFETLRRLAREATFQEEMVRFQNALARFPSPGLLEKALELALSPEVRAQDTPRLVIAVASHPRGLRPAWGFMKRQWAEFDRRYGSGGFAIMRLVAITGYLTSREDYQDVAGFFQAHPTPTASRTIQQSLERIELNRQWLEANRQGLGGWLRSRAGG